MKSKFIAIEGLDGSGKSTQIELLIEYFRNRGIETRFIHFPRSGEGVYGELVAKFLRGEFGRVGEVHPQLVALLFAGDRKDFAQTIRQWLQEGFCVLVDRYVLSNIAFQCAKIDDPEKKELREWINHFEYDYNNIPMPDLSFYLEVPFPFIEKSLKERLKSESREYLKGKEDIHEMDFTLQKAVKKEYEFLLETDPSVTRITCYNSENNMKPVPEIHQMIVERIV